MAYARNQNQTRDLRDLYRGQLPVISGGGGGSTTTVVVVGAPTRVVIGSIVRSTPTVTSITSIGRLGPTTSVGTPTTSTGCVLDLLIRVGLKLELFDVDVLGNILLQELGDLLLGLQECLGQKLSQGLISLGVEREGFTLQASSGGAT